MGAGTESRALCGFHSCVVSVWVCERWDYGVLLEVQEAGNLFKGQIWVAPFF